MQGASRRGWLGPAAPPAGPPLIENERKTGVDSAGTHTSTISTILTITIPWSDALANMLLSATSSNCASTTSAEALAVMLEKEQHSYQRCPPNPHVPLAEYTQDRPLLVN
ncbi:hypothetical protein THAOC_24147, partial [Thalassiosira oceanica]